MSSDYNKELCEDRHDNIEKEFGKVWDAIKNNDKKLDRILIGLVFNLGVGIAIGIMLLIFRGYAQ